MKHPWLLVLILFVSGCGHYARPPDLDALKSPTLPEVPAKWQSIQSETAVVGVGWIEALDDPRLIELVNQALESNRDLQSTLANLERSRAIARASRSAIKPSLDFELNAAETGPVDGSSNDAYGSGIDLGWQLDVFGRLRAEIRSAEYAAGATEQDYRFAQYSLVAALAQSYFLAIETAAQAAVAEKSYLALVETDRIVQAKLDTGSADAYEAELTRADLATAEANLIEANGAHSSVLRALNVLLGDYPVAKLDIASELPKLPELPASGVPSELLDRRPDLVSAELSIASAFSNLNAKRAARLPSFSLGGSVDANSTDLKDVFDFDGGVWAISAAVLGPLVDGGLRRAEIEQATAEQKQAIASYGQAVLNAFQEVENSLDQYQVLSAQTKALKRAANSQNTAFELAQFRYREGETELLDVLTVQSNRLAADSAHLSARRTVLDEWVNLMLALGGNPQL